MSKLLGKSFKNEDQESFPQSRQEEKDPRELVIKYVLPFSISTSFAGFAASSSLERVP